MEYFLNKYPYTDFHQLNADWLISSWKELIEDVDKLDSWKVTHEAEYEQLEQLYNDIVIGDFPASMISALEKWFDDNAFSLVGEMIKHVYFGLTNDGYFCAFIPDNWSDIHFDTITDFNDPLYGHLVLMYD